MELETVVGYLVALAVPLWLAAEGIMVSQRLRKRPKKRLTPEKLPDRRAPGAPVRATMSTRT